VRNYRGQLRPDRGEHVNPGLGAALSGRAPASQDRLTHVASGLGGPALASGLELSELDVTVGTSLFEAGLELGTAGTLVKF
jgi:hypothetical protein